MMVLELALFPPLARFFIGLLLIGVVISIEIAFSYFIFTQYKKGE